MYIKLTFPENRTFTKRTIKVTVTVQDDTDYTYTLVQDAFSGILADWDLNSLTANTSEHLLMMRHNRYSREPMASILLRVPEVVRLSIGHVTGQVM